MADVHWPGRIGADIFDVDLAFDRLRRAAEVEAALEYGDEHPRVCRQREADVDEAGARDFDRLHVRRLSEDFGQRFGQGARIAAGRLGFARVDHRRIGRQVAVRRLARRLDDEAGKVEIGRRPPRRRQVVQRGAHPGLEILENIHELRPGPKPARLYRKFAVGSKSRRYSFSAKRSVMPAM